MVFITSSFILFSVVKFLLYTLSHNLLQKYSAFFTTAILLNFQFQFILLGFYAIEQHKMIVK